MAFDPYDAKTFYVEGAKDGWAGLEKMGEARYIWKQGFSKGDTVYYDEMDGVPTAGGRYQLVIQEQGKDGWFDAACFPFTIGSAVSIEGDLTEWESTAMTFVPRPMSWWSSSIASRMRCISIPGIRAQSSR